MSIEQATNAVDLAVRGRPSHRSGAKAAQYIFFGMFGTGLAVAIPAVLALFGIGMSPQEQDVAINGAAASVLAIVVSFFIVRRLLNFPLLRPYDYAALTFFGSSAVVAGGLKFFRIDFSSPQFFLGIIIITAMVELFLYFHRHRAPMNIAIVPGTGVLTQLPNSLFGSIKFTRLVGCPSDPFEYTGVVADLTVDLDPEWENFLAISALRGIPVYHFKHFNESLSGRVALDYLWENTLGAIIPALIYPQLKRCLDVLGALLLLPFVVPVLGICAVLIKWETSGPIFFRQQRVGLGGRPFSVFKLRTMKVDHNGHDYTVPDDGRVTRVGRVLRQYRVDELPQVINILRGEMSWIGPRPEAMSLAEWYEREVPFYAYRHIVRPGISGWAQVHQGNVGAVDAARLKLEYDFFYIKHFSIWLDAVIVIKTVRTIATRFGAS